MTGPDIDGIRKATLGFLARHRMPDAGPAAYRYSTAAARPTLYSSTYAAMTRSLYDDLGALTNDERRQWIEHFNRRQDDDGLYRDPVIFNEGWYAGDPFWCGRPHLTCHVITALTCLGGTAAKAFAFLEPYRDTDGLPAWLATRDWGSRVGWSGNEIMNVGMLLQYARDFHNDDRAARATAAMLDWLAANHLDPDTGLWGDLDTADPVQRSHAVQAAYHLWPLLVHDGRPVPYVERAIDSVLATQNPAGGFGWGVHNPDQPLKSSACEDIDSIDPLARMTRQSDYRRGDVLAALTKAADWVLRNRTADGGFTFMLDLPFEYGHPQLYAPAGVGAMFPTWFRTLSLALIGKALPSHPLGGYPWRFVRSPGYQFWTREDRRC